MEKRRLGRAERQTNKKQLFKNWQICQQCLDFKVQPTDMRVCTRSVCVQSVKESGDIHTSDKVVHVL